MRIPDVMPVSFIFQLRCDRCGAEAQYNDGIGFNNIAQIGFDASFGSELGDGNRVDIDLCHRCLAETLGPWLRISGEGQTNASLAAILSGDRVFGGWTEAELEGRTTRESASTRESQNGELLNSDESAAEPRGEVLRHDRAANSQETGWKIGREGRRWSMAEALQKLDMLPGRLEFGKGKLCIDEEEREALLGGILENFGLDAVVMRGDAHLWLQAIAARFQRMRQPEDDEPPNT